MLGLYTFKIFSIYLLGSNLNLKSAKQTFFRYNLPYTNSSKYSKWQITLNDYLLIGLIDIYGEVG